MPRFTLDLSWSMKWACIELSIGSMSDDCALALSKPSLAPISRAPMSETSSSSFSESIVLRLIRERSSIRKNATPVSARLATSALATAKPRRNGTVPLTAASAHTYSHGTKTSSRRALPRTLINCWSSDLGFEPSSLNRR